MERLCLSPFQRGKNSDALYRSSIEGCITGFLETLVQNNRLQQRTFRGTVRNFFASPSILDTPLLNSISETKSRAGLPLPRACTLFCFSGSSLSQYFRLVRAHVSLVLLFHLRPGPPVLTLLSTPFSIWCENYILVALPILTSWSQAVKTAAEQE